MMSQHSLPIFEGRWSRRHAPVSVESLVERADIDLATCGPPAPKSFVQFAGFPRSGHSLVGAILGTHPQAVMAHELDAMGLVEAGVERDQLLALIRLNAADFAESGHWWNGFCYAGRPNMAAESTNSLLFGDKKGDRLLRRFARRPEIFDSLLERFEGFRLPWIVVLRNPYDNVATMSLRKGRHYDRLRIRSGSTKIPVKGYEEIPRAVLPEIVDDYATLCETLASFRGARFGHDMLIVRHESFVAGPSEAITGLCNFLGLPVYQEFLEGASNIVNRETNRSRFKIEWPPSLRRQVADLIDKYDIFSGYDWAS